VIRSEEVTNVILKILIKVEDNISNDSSITNMKKLNTSLSQSIIEKGINLPDCIIRTRDTTVPCMTSCCCKRRSQYAGYTYVGISTL